MAQKTIKLSELNALKKACANNREDAEYYFEAWQKKLYEVVAVVVRNRDLKDKLWAAEQEIHDLKAHLESQIKRLCSEQDIALETLTAHEKTIQRLTNQLIDLACGNFSPHERIEIPSCLKPKDAFDYQYDIVTRYYGREI